MTSIRCHIESSEARELAQRATRSVDAARRRPEAPSPMRTDFQRDRDRIIHANSFRRLQAKTQVFLPPAGDHVRTRLTHTLEVMQIARTISRALRLNADLTEAIALGHDLGHTPFGHAGEVALARVFPGFRHNQQSLRIVDMLENGGRGLNLTDQVRDGILRHSKPVETMAGDVAGVPATPEAQVVKISDGIAYINHDLQDALRHGILDQSEIPASVINTLGIRHSQRIDRLVNSVIEASRDNIDDPSATGQLIIMGGDELGAADALRTFLFDRVYNPINDLPSTRHAQNIVQELFDYFARQPDHPALSNLPTFEGEASERRAADFVAGMTDPYARRMYETLFLPSFEEI